METKLTKGQWLFTCAMVPKQFKCYHPKNANDYPNAEEGWRNFNDFETMEGAFHSQGNCGCSPVSEEYAKWFLENKIHELYDEDEDEEVRWENYEKRIKERCAKDVIKYEGY